MKKLYFFLLLLLMLAMLVLPASAHTATVSDNGDLLSDTDEELLGRACKCTDYNVDFYIVTRDKAATPLTDSAARKACGIADGDSAIVLLLRRHGGTYYYDMYTFGEAYDIFADSDVDAVLDDPKVYDNLKSGNLGAGCEAFTLHCQSILNEHYYKEAERERRAPLTAVLFGVIIGALSAGVTVLCVFLSYRRKTRGETYPLDRYARLYLTESRDIFAGSFVTRVRIQSNNSSGGGRSGGGGGHRGGR